MKVALVTGAAKRLGRAMALYLAGRGYDVAVHYDRSADEAEDVASQVRRLGVAAMTIQTNLLDEGATASLIPRVAEKLGQLSVLVNSASIFEYDNIRSATMENWNRHIGSNLRAPFQLIQAFAAQAAPATIDRLGEPLATGLVVNMVDQRVLKPTPEFMTYSLAKAGLWSLTRTAAQALAPAIRVNAIGPGPTMIGTRQSPEHYAAQRAATVLQRGAHADDVTDALGYFLDAKAVTGQLICVDGGQHLCWQTNDVQGRG